MREAWITLQDSDDSVCWIRFFEESSFFTWFLSHHYSKGDRQNTQTIMLDLLWITIIIVFGIDLSGFIGSISQRIWKWLYPNIKYNGWMIPKPFSCSLCSTFWIGLLYLLITGSFSWFMLMYVALLSLFTPVIATILLFVKDSLIWLVNKIYELID